MTDVIANVIESNTYINKNLNNGLSQHSSCVFRAKGDDAF